MHTLGDAHVYSNHLDALDEQVIFLVTSGLLQLSIVLPQSYARRLLQV